MGHFTPLTLAINPSSLCWNPSGQPRPLAWTTAAEPYPLSLPTPLLRASHSRPNTHRLHFHARLVCQAACPWTRAPAVLTARDMPLSAELVQMTPSQGGRPLLLQTATTPHTTPHLLPLLCFPQQTSHSPTHSVHFSPGHAGDRSNQTQTPMVVRASDEGGAEPAPCPPRPPIHVASLLRRQLVPQPSGKPCPSTCVAASPGVTSEGTDVCQSQGQCHS